MECGKSAASVVRKVKKKQVKDELDRIKQAEKKKRRLEKALAASAAIISELEKKNQKKREEQQRLDEECAAIAEAVALQVLIGEESDQNQKDEEWYPSWGCYDSGQVWGSPNGETGWVSSGYGGPRCEGNGYGYGYGLGNVHVVEEREWEGVGEVSEGALMAAQAISSLQIADDTVNVNAFVFNRMVRG
ncbi:uncharacterized protein LOC111888446 [Lactuca sativa]|uniref:Uncharacterized protein n=1 Tax=Lactuca sativa TaxID=4236 RepID=A0A9R1WEH3_LACSA|nr:uncharacterized protein LOC111888446 [Lactuca sativa]XP_023740383.1 uncharacterized protein LOC111888446 [Lactuca sativa]XP_023740385.1 uncharacterized protein LOC111888446 [Lactuca sativa]XP_023740387.1 uncharacterized protein LOC111888446 [Lactuca sativa]KAJ0223715.1 hypothetical protein LSAT_V11C200099330 [Lactuca sativa]